jgi:hypothetical protein
MMSHALHFFQKNVKKQRFIFGATAFFFILFIIGAMYFGLSRMSAWVFSMPLLLLLPGLWISYYFYPDSEKCFADDDSSKRSVLDPIERTTLAFALSVVTTSIVVYGLGTVVGGVKLQPKNLAVAILFVNIILFAVAATKKRWISRVSAVSIGAPPIILVALNIVSDVPLVWTIIIPVLVFFSGGAVCIELWRWKSKEKII